MQSIFLKPPNLIKQFNKLSLTNRLNNLIILPSCMGMKQEAKDLMAKLKIPEKPKKPLSAYMQYLVEKRPKIKIEHPNLSTIEIVQKAAEEWKHLGPDLKLNYANKAKQNKEEYDKKFLDFSSRLTPEQKTVLQEIQNELREDAKRRKLKREVRQQNKPKKPASPYALFLQDYAQQHGRKIRYIMAEMKGKWADLTEGQKHKYNSEYAANKSKFDTDIAEWEAKMIAEGREKLVRTKTLKAYKVIKEETPRGKKPT